MSPTLAGFLTFIRQVMGIDTAHLPDNSPVITMAFNVAMLIVNRQLQQTIPEIYTLAVYNLAGDNLINYAPDAPGKTYFETLRVHYNINSFISGVITAAADETTSQTLGTSEALKNLTLSDLQNMKTPYGRQYLAFAQRVGTLWGVS